MNFFLFRGTLARIWIDHALQEMFGVAERLSGASAGAIYDYVSACLTQDAFRPRALFERFNIEVMSTTESAQGDLKWHQMIHDSGWGGKVITAYRPDAVIDPDFEGLAANVARLGKLIGEDTTTWDGYLAAHRSRRAFFKSFGETPSDYGLSTARSENLPTGEAAGLFDKALHGTCSAEDAGAFREHMLTKMARMSLEDGLVLQIHTGSYRNHSDNILARFGRNMGYDIPTRTDYVRALKPVLGPVGDERDLTIIVFSIDETSFSRELAPFAGICPALKLGPSSWFLDSCEGMSWFRETATETAGSYNIVGFNDDTRAFCSIPARHDVARRVDCGHLATLVATGRLGVFEAPELAHDLAYRLAKQAFRL